ncbi:MAG: sulfatase-like hydrolase/transferase [Kiritimatiellia bacterium]
MSHLMMAQAWFSILFDRDQGYFNHLRVTPVVLFSLIASLGLLTIPLFLAIRYWRRHATRVHQTVMAVIALLCLVPPVNFVRYNFCGLQAGVIYKWVSSPVFLVVLLVAGAVVLVRPHWVARLCKAFSVILLPLAVVSMARIILVLLGLQRIHQHAGEVAARAPRLASDPAAPRVVWIIFDELDRRVTFEDRPDQVSLPQLDLFRAGALDCSQAFPPAQGTALSLPALLCGKPVIRVEPRNASELNLAFSEEGPWEGWTDQPTVLSLAREAGFNCGVVAWYHPYDRLFSRYLTECFCHPFPAFEQARGRTFGECMGNQIFSMISPVQQRRLAIRLHRESTEEACRLVADAGLGLVFLHLQGPHRPGIFDRDKQTYTWKSFSIVREYLDNLALTDLTLGRIRDSMEKAGLWDSSWVLLSADHRWREAHVFDGRSDMRVPFLIKPPGETWSGHLDKTMNTVLTRDLILAMLRREIKGGPDAADWIVQRSH